MFLERIKLQNLLSFGTLGIDLELRPLNVLIGPNGSGKSNFIDSISLLQAAPRHLGSLVKNQEWIFKGATLPLATIEAEIAVSESQSAFVHTMSFCRPLDFFYLLSEDLCRVDSSDSVSTLLLYECQKYPENLRPHLEGKKFIGKIRNKENQLRDVSIEEMGGEQSVLSLLRGRSEEFPEIAWLGEMYSRICIYRDWKFGRKELAEFFRISGDSSGGLAEDSSNLEEIIARYVLNSELKQKILEGVYELSPDIDDLVVEQDGSRRRVFSIDTGRRIPISRFSDGLLRYLGLLAILHNPYPPPLICIEEPELGLHPDVHVAIGKLLKEASQRTQLIVTTHSEVLVDCFTETPEDVVVCEKVEGQSQFKRLDKGELSHWLEDYSLGNMWRRGAIGGNRW